VATVQLTLSADQLKGVGHVAVQWAFLEYEIPREIAWLLKRSEHRRKRFNFREPFAKIANQWLKLATRSYKKDPKLIKNVQSAKPQTLSLSGTKSPTAVTAQAGFFSSHATARSSAFQTRWVSPPT
jgi:hypothetical protein